MAAGISVSAPGVFYDPQLQYLFCYIARYYVKEIACAPGGHKKFMLTKRGGGGVETELIRR